MMSDEAFIASVSREISESNAMRDQELSRVKSALNAALGDSLVKTVAPKVEPRIVAFVDLLGTSNLMESVNTNNATETYLKYTGIVEYFKDHVETFKDRFPDVYYQVISDSYVISAPVDQLVFEKLIELLSSFQWHCLNRYSQLIRGGVAVDVMIANVLKVIIGKAFIKAHKIEMGYAIYPRIVVDSQVGEVLQIDDLTKRYPIVRDEDGLLYVNSCAGQTKERIAELSDRLLSEYEKYLGDFSKMGIAQKWMRQQSFLLQNLQNT